MFIFYWSWPCLLTHLSLAPWRYLTMSVDISIYRGRVGLLGPYQLRISETKPLSNFELVTWLLVLRIISSDIHVNQGPFIE